MSREGGKKNLIVSPSLPVLSCRSRSLSGGFLGSPRLLLASQQAPSNKAGIITTVIIWKTKFSFWQNPVPFFESPLMQGWVAPLRFQLLPSQNCGATPYGSGGWRRTIANAGHEGVIFARGLTEKLSLDRGLVTSITHTCSLGRGTLGRSLCKTSRHSACVSASAFSFSCRAAGRGRKENRGGRVEMSTSLTKSQGNSKTGEAAGSQESLHSLLNFEKKTNWALNCPHSGHLVTHWLVTGHGVADTVQTYSLVRDCKTSASCRASAHMHDLCNKASHKQHLQPTAQQVDATRWGVKENEEESGQTCSALLQEGASQVATV